MSKLNLKVARLYSLAALFVILLFLFWGEPDVIDVARDYLIRSLSMAGRGG